MCLNKLLCNPEMKFLVHKVSSFLIAQLDVPDNSWYIRAEYCYSALNVNVLRALQSASSLRSFFYLIFKCPNKDAMNHVPLKLALTDFVATWVQQRLSVNKTSNTASQSCASANE